KNLQVGSAFQNFSTLIKLLLIGALIAAGLFVHPKQPIDFLPAPGDTTLIFGASFAVALVYVMYSYSGWNAAVYISGEIKRPEKPAWYPDECDRPATAHRESPFIYPQF